MTSKPPKTVLWSPTSLSDAENADALRATYAVAFEQLFRTSADPEKPPHLSDAELAAWIKRYQVLLEGSSDLRRIIDELRDRRDAEAIFVEVDRQFQAVDCQTCDDQGADNCEEHKLLVRQWSCARAALCDLARLHRGYLRNLNAPNEGDP